jgi:hypothetical protein
MKITVLALLVLALVPFCAFAVDGQVLINQSTVIAAGGFPYRITQPGSYKLSGNLIVNTATDGIEIDSDDVTLDLNGFTISCTSTLCRNVLPLKSAVSGLQFDTTVKNGSVRGFGFGLSLNGSGLVSEIKAINNFDIGISVTFLVVSGSTFGHGGFVVERCTANENGTGIFASNSEVTNSTTNSNTSAGLNGGGGAFLNNVSINNSVGLVLFTGLYGGNSFQGNVTPVSISGGAISQNNNNCNGSGC